MSAQLEIQLLGPLHVSVGGVPLPPLRSKKGQYLLALLVLHADRSIEREYLAGLLWPDSDHSQAMYSLRRSLTDLRSALNGEGDRIQSPTPHSLRIDLSGARSDVQEFDAAVKRGDFNSLDAAISLYRGPLVEGCGEDWIIPERTARETEYLEALETLAESAIQRGDFSRAAGYLRRAISADGLRETAQRSLMSALAASKEFAAVTQVYRDFRLLLRRELNAEPAPETIALFNDIQQTSKQLFASPEKAPEERNGSGASNSSTHSANPTGGALPLNSIYYVSRPADGDLRSALARRDSIVLIKGAGQHGKTSMLARGLDSARGSGVRIVLTDFSALPASVLASDTALLKALCDELADQLDLETTPSSVWREHRTAPRNLERYLVDMAMEACQGGLVWAMDEVDRLFAYTYAAEVFGLFRSWHNRRALDPSGPWPRLTLAMSYTTEAHLFITDINQSPFNVGTHVFMTDFTKEQVAELNSRYHSPLCNPGEVESLYRLVNGHPFLVHRAIAEMSAQRLSLADVEDTADSEYGLFGSHLRSISSMLARDSVLAGAVRELLEGRSIPGSNDFYRLRSAGVLAGEAREEARFRCQIYQRYLAKNLR